MVETSECLLCEKVIESTKSMKSHLSEAHLNEVALTALQPTAEPTSIWIQNALWNGAIYQQDTALEIQDNADEGLEVSSLSEQTEKSPTLSPCESITSQASRLSDNPICARKVSISSSNGHKSDVPDDANLSAEPSAKSSDQESPHSAENIVDSFSGNDITSGSISSSTKEENTVVALFCQECKEIVDETDKQRHLYEVHSKQHLFKCPLCDYAASVEDSVDDHLNQFHASFNMIGAISQIDQFVEDIASWEERCFRSPNRRLLRDVQSGTSGKGCCRICGKVRFKHKKVHIYYHMNVRKMFSCPSCDYAHSNRSDEVRRHMKACHKDINASVISRETEFSSQFNQMKEKCFPQLIGKSAQPPVVQKCQFQCRVCGKSVTDRKIHVYGHMNVLKMFSCPLCACAHSSRISFVRAHMKKHHKNDSTAVISREAEFSSQFSEMKEKCFPGPDGRTLYKRQKVRKQPPNAISVAKDKQSSLRNAKDSSPPALSSRDASFSMLQARLKEECFPGH